MIQIKFKLEIENSEEYEDEENTVLFVTINNVLYSYDYSDDENNFYCDFIKEYPRATRSQIKYWIKRFNEEIKEVY